MPNLPARSYVICTAPRSGSTLLCRMLSATGQAGQPDSHFHTPSMQRWLDVFDLAGRALETRRDALRAIFDAARCKGMGETDIFGLRLQRGSFDYFKQQLALCHPDLDSDIDRFKAAFGPTLFIHLSRPDRLGQAISRLRAEQTGLWHRSSDGTEMERLTPAKPAEYEATAIRRYMADAIALDAEWRRWFDGQGLTPMRIRYDALARDPQNVLADVLSALDLDPALAQTVATPTARLADAETDQWRARFLAGP